MIAFLVVGTFAIVQSLFGVGLLVFGTPTLLLLGYSFPDTLAILLPASLAVSALQLWKGPETDRKFAAQFFIWCLVPLIVGLALVLALHLKTSLNFLVAIILIIFVVLRATPKSQERSRCFILGNQQIWLMLMGFVHGLTNLGGGLLTILASSLYREKEQIRHIVAVCYACFAAIQLAVLAVLTPDVFGWMQFAYAAASAIVFLCIGQHVFRWISAAVFHRLFTALMATYAMLLLFQVFGAL